MRLELDSVACREFVFSFNRRDQFLGHYELIPICSSIFVINIYKESLKEFIAMESYNISKRSIDYCSFIFKLCSYYKHLVIYMDVFSSR